MKFEGNTKLIAFALLVLVCVLAALAVVLRLARIHPDSLERSRWWIIGHPATYRTRCHLPYTLAHQRRLGTFVGDYPVVMDVGITASSRRIHT